MKLPKSLFSLCVILALAAPVTASADVLLTVDFSNPSAVKIMATGGFPSVANSSTTFLDGVDLAQFFKSSTGVGGSTSGTLTTGTSGTLFYTDYSDDDLSGTFADLSLYRNGSSTTQSFQTGTAAFSGTAVLSLTDYTNADISPQGTLYAGYSGSSHVAIGTWSNVTVVPEPSQLPIYGLLGCMVLLVFRQLRIRSKAVAR